MEIILLKGFTKYYLNSVKFYLKSYWADTNLDQ